MKHFTTLLALLLLAFPGLHAQDASGKATPSAADAKKVELTDAQVIARQLPSYPSDKCLLSDESLDSMGGAIDMVHEGRLVRFCCKGCIKGFKKEPAKMLAKLDQQVIAAQKADYPLETCAISDEPLGSMGDPIDLVVGTRLVRLCCKGCVRSAKKKPEVALKKINAAYIAAQSKTYPLSTCLVSGEPLEGEGVDHLHGITLTRFCCKRCLAAFRKSPEDFLPKLAEKQAKKAPSKG